MPKGTDLNGLGEAGPRKPRELFRRTRIALGERALRVRPDPYLYEQLADVLAESLDMRTRFALSGCATDRR